MGKLTPELEKHRLQIKKIAEDSGLDFFETIFELVSYKELNKIAAGTGFPVRYPHWKFGMDYEQLSKGYEYGLSKIYELVINTDPCYAYLMEGNEVIDQKLVMAHVFGHCDFFKNNQFFSKTNRKMMDAMANHAIRVRRYIDQYGIEEVESFIDACLSLDNLIDRFSVYKSIEITDESPNRAKENRFDEEALAPGRFKVSRRYMESYINPPEAIEEAERLRKEREAHAIFPRKPEKDVLKFLIENAPLAPWQQDILSIIRDEAYYFAPQGMTKIMNEGWASYWHAKLMTEQIMNSSEIIDFADRHSGTMAMAPNGFNPYKIGIELFRKIEDRWNKGQFGPEWDSCDNLAEKKVWNTNAMKGREKIFEVRRNMNDVMFIDEFLTEEFCVENKMFVYKFNKQTNQFEVDTKDFKAIKAKLLFQLTNFGQPTISVVDANFENRGELLLGHVFEGIELQPDYMEATMKNLQGIWRRPVNLATVMDGEGRIFRFDGKKFTSVSISELSNEEAKAKDEKQESKSS
ncbi:MAG: SpoVR family protein [Bdellovibrionales bacterium]|nr:SpoVR family protein [Bdellovibrionales bacterium]